MSLPSRETSSLTSNQITSIDSVRGKQEPSLEMRKNNHNAPRWLLDLKMVTSEEKIISRNANRSENPTQGNGRPVTDHCVNLKPEWFEDMLQKRRHSDQEVRPTNDNSIFGSDEEEWIEKKEKVDIKKVSLIQTDPILDVQRLKLSMKPFLSSRRASMSINDPYPIPALPAGQKLMIEILENWGDEETIGLNGIEIFESVEGKIENFKNFSLKHKSSINDESTIRRKLLCPPFRTHDDNHIWTCDWNPFSSDSIQICITFNNTIRLALLRFWNYNKSRIYSYRGIKTVQVSLDDQIIFKGEIARADGELRCQPGRLGDTIVFTTDEEILERVADTDDSYHELLSDLSR